MCLVRNPTQNARAKIGPYIGTKLRSLDEKVVDNNRVCFELIVLVGLKSCVGKQVNYLRPRDPEISLVIESVKQVYDITKERTIFKQFGFPGH